MLRQTIRNALHAAGPVDFKRDLRWRNVRRIHIDRLSVMAKNVNNSQRPACLFV